MNLWLPLAVRWYDLPTLANRLTPQTIDPRLSGLSVEEIRKAVLFHNRWIIRMRGRRCVRKSLLAYHFLNRAGHPAVLHVGVYDSSVGTGRTRGHCYVSSAGQCVISHPAEPMTLLYQIERGIKQKLSGGLAYDLQSII